MAKNEPKSRLTATLERVNVILLATLVIIQSVQNIRRRRRG